MDKAQTEAVQSCWALLGRDDFVDAVARWDGLSGKLQQLYVAAERVGWTVEEIGSREFEQRVHKLLMAGCMVPYYEVLDRQRVFRFDWDGWSYLLTLDVDEAGGRQQLRPGVVYTLVTATPPKAERLTDFDELIKLLLVPGSLTLEGVEPEQYPDHQVTIWEESAGRAYIQN